MSDTAIRIADHRLAAFAADLPAGAGDVEYFRRQAVFPIPRVGIEWRTLRNRGRRGNLGPK